MMNTGALLRLMTSFGGRCHYWLTVLLPLILFLPGSLLAQARIDITDHGMAYAHAVETPVEVYAYGEMVINRTNSSPLAGDRSRPEYLLHALRVSPNAAAEAALYLEPEAVIAKPPAHYQAVSQAGDDALEFRPQLRIDQFVDGVHYAYLKYVIRDVTQGVELQASLRAVETPAGWVISNVTELSAIDVVIYHYRADLLEDILSRPQSPDSYRGLRLTGTGPLSARVDFPRLAKTFQEYSEALSPGETLSTTFFSPIIRRL